MTAFNGDQVDRQSLQCLPLMLPALLTALLGYDIKTRKVHLFIPGGDMAVKRLRS